MNERHRVLSARSYDGGFFVYHRRQKNMKENKGRNSGHKVHDIHEQDCVRTGVWWMAVITIFAIVIAVGFDMLFTKPGIQRSIDGIKQELIIINERIDYKLSVDSVRYDALKNVIPQQEQETIDSLFSAASEPMKDTMNTVKDKKYEKPDLRFLANHKRD